jgi:hypothetical protein
MPRVSRPAAVTMVMSVPARTPASTRMTVQATRAVPEARAWIRSALTLVTARPRYTGTKLCVNVNDCASNACGTGGRCIDGVQGYKCECNAGFSGTGTTRCTNIDDCASDPCAPGGTCRDGVSSYTCNCSISADTDNRCPHKDNGDGTIYDADTNLTWQKSRTSLPWQTPEEESFPVCTLSSVAGGGWRIPSCDEIFGIMHVIDSTRMSCFQGAESLCCQINSPRSTDHVRCAVRALSLREQRRP